MAHIGIKRLGAGDGEKHRPEHDEAAPWGSGQYFDAVYRVQRQ